VTVLSSEALARIGHLRGIVFDMDGTLVLGDVASGGHRALPGAIELIDMLRRKGLPFRVFTNGTAKAPAVYAASLRHAGLDVCDAEMMTPSTAAADWFVTNGIRRVRVLGLDGVQRPLRDAGLDVVGPSEQADGVEAVFTGWFREFTMPDLEAACRDIWSGAKVTTASNVPFFAALGGRAIGVSFAINAMIKALTDTQAQVLGKPARASLDCALRLMGIAESDAAHTLVVGDDPALEMRMANSAGAMSIGVTTGLATAETFADGPPEERPSLVLGSLLPLIEALR
jgi:HAD superfamily hydrolase (TIGR01450 family)